MKCRMLGKDLKVSSVGLGCMGMSHAYDAPADEKQMTVLLSKAVNIGYTFFDGCFVKSHGLHLYQKQENLTD